MPKMYDDPHIAPTVYVVAVLVVVFIGSVFALEGYFGRVSREERQTKVVDRPWKELEQVRTQQQALIERYAWVDRKEGIVAIPVERAMDLVAAELERTDGSVDPR
jgi:hypothetical protein